MESPNNPDNTPPPLIRITRIANRHLVFDARDVATLRRRHAISAVFTGTLPQSPAQSVFLGLPVELYAEEARLLVARGVAYLYDGPAAHLAHLSRMTPGGADADGDGDGDAARQAYVRALRAQRRNAQRAVDEDAKRRKKGVVKFAAVRREQEEEKDGSEAGEVEGAEEEDLLLFDAPPPRSTTPTPTPTSTSTVPKKGDVVSITPSTSADLLLLPDPATATYRTDSDSVLPSSSAEVAGARKAEKAYPLYAHLNARGYYVTPGLRFGGDYSVYPGDPFRYHAHFLTCAYGWDEEIPMLDIVTSGRLGTSVKKGFLMGGRGRGPSSSFPGDEEEGGGGEEVRTFSVEWAGM